MLQTLSVAIHILTKLSVMPNSLKDYKKKQLVAM